MKGLKTGVVTIALLVSSAGLAGEGVSSTVLGTNDALAAGSRALQLGSYDEGIRLTQRGLASETRRLQRARGFSNLCAGYAGTREYDKALGACGEALALNDRNWRAFNNLALTLTGLGRAHEARRALARAFELRPDSPTLQQTRAWIDERAPRVMLAGASD
ncbi:MAG: tetratricopeptide repeat protein [Gammaproteobacteria bacterium]|nr:tetratricopeptide repeat protein [Gammaproteobacteria bacterium]